MAKLQKTLKLWKFVSIWGEGDESLDSFKKALVMVFGFQNDRCMKKLALILTAAAGLTMTAHNSQAGLGWTLDQSIQRYGDPTSGPADDHYGSTFYRFHADGYAITAFYTHAKLSRITYEDANGLDKSAINALLSFNAPNADWSSFPDENGNVTCVGNVDGEQAYTGVLGDGGNMLVIFTIEDAGATSAAKVKNAMGL